MESVSTTPEDFVEEDQGARICIDEPHGAFGGRDRGRRTTGRDPTGDRPVRGIDGDDLSARLGHARRSVVRSVPGEGERQARSRHHSESEETEDERTTRHAAGSRDSLRSERRKRTRNTFDLELVEPLGPVEVLEREGPELANERVGWKLVLHQLPRRVGEQDLAAMAHRADARRTVHAEAHVPLSGRTRLTRVQPHPDTDIDAIRPGVACERALRLGRAGDGVACPPEREEERVTLRVDLSPAVRLEALPQDALVIREDDVVLLAELLEEPRRPFDVGEEKRDGPGRQFSHPSPFCPQLGNPMLAPGPRHSGHGSGSDRLTSTRFVSRGGRARDGRDGRDYRLS